MADMVTKQELEDAKVDVKHAGEAVNTKKVITPRYGQPFNSFPLELDNLAKAIQFALAAGAGAAGWIASLVVDASGKTQQELNNSMQIEIEKLRKGGQFLELKQFDPDGSGSGVKATQAYIDKANAWYALTGVDEPRFKFGFDSQDFVALQWALDTAGYNGQTLILNSADYVLTKCLIVKFNNVTVIGAGKFSSKLSQKASAGWVAEPSDDSQILVGGKVYGSANYETGKNWSETRVYQADNFKMIGVGVVGDMSGFNAGGWYIVNSGATPPTLKSTALLQSGVQIQGELSRFSKNIEITDCYFSGHAECGIEPSYIDGLIVDKCYATQNGWQFFGTDHSIKNVWITNNIGIEPAVGNSESAFIDLEEGQGASFENIYITGNKHIATSSGFLKLHPRGAANIKNVQVIGNYSNAFGAPTLGFVGQFWTGSDTAGLWGNVENLVVSQNIILNYKGDVFRIGASDAGSGKAINVNINDNIIVAHQTEAKTNSVIFSIPKLVEDLSVSGNTIIAKSGKQYLSRIGWQSASDDTKIPKNISFKDNNVLINASAYIFDVSQVDGLVISGNELDASITNTTAFGGFFGMQPGGRKHNITVKGNSKIMLGQRDFLMAYYQQVKNLIIEDNVIFAETPDTATRTLFNLNQQVIGASIKCNIIKSGIQQILSIGGGVSTVSANKCANISFDDNIIEHSCSDIAFEPRQCVNFGFSRNKVESKAGGSGLIVPVYTTSGMFLLEGRTTVKDNEFSGLCSGTQRLGIRLSYNVDDSKSIADVSGNTLQAMAGSYMSYPIAIEGKPRIVKVNDNILFGVENAANRYAVTLTGSSSTNKIQAIVTGNIAHGGALTQMLNTDANTNLTQGANHLSTLY